MPRSAAGNALSQVLEAVRLRRQSCAGQERSSNSKRDSEGKAASAQSSSAGKEQG